MQSKGLLFDIQGFSVHDGPGCRTTLFFMGCPLRCQWCANPEGWLLRRRMLFRTTRCLHGRTGCIRCLERCPSGALASGTGGALQIDRQLCASCDTLECTEACLTEAMVACGNWVSVNDLMNNFRRDRQYWGDAGGVTFSGGDPLVQTEFLRELLEACRESYIHTAVETSGCFPHDEFVASVAGADFVFMDIKHMDEGCHREQTGVSNQLVLSNIAALAAADWSGRLILRMPLIPGFNDNVENIVATADFARAAGCAEINILPFHRLGESKWRQCGLEYPYGGMPSPTAANLLRVKRLMEDCGMRCYLGANTPF